MFNFGQEHIRQWTQSCAGATEEGRHENLSLIQIVIKQKKKALLSTVYTFLSDNSLGSFKSLRKHKKFFL